VDSMRLRGIRKKLDQSCGWCGNVGVDTSKDHVFPGAIGGTLRVSVASCTKCQISLSKAEKEFSRRSLYAVFTADGGPKGRHKGKPGSGLIQPRFLLVRHPLGGYCESFLEAGCETPFSQPYIEIDVATSQARRRGAKPEDVEKLVTRIKEMLDSKPDARGLVAEIQVRTDDLKEIGADPDFWPRIVLDPAGDLFIRSRNPEEATRFMRALTLLVQNYDQFPYDPKSWSPVEITSGTPHAVLFAFRHAAIQRVIAKVACGVATVGLGRKIFEEPIALEVRRFALEDQFDKTCSSVEQICLPGVLKSWPELHVAAVVELEGKLLGIVSLYGDCNLVEFGPAPSKMNLKIPIAAHCRKSGGDTRMLMGESALSMSDELKRQVLLLRGPNKG